MNRSNIKTLQILCLACFIACISSCKNPAGNQHHRFSETPTPQSVPVETESISDGVIANTIETSANIEAEEDITIYPKMFGHVNLIKIEEGDHVKKYQLMCKLEDDELQLRVKQAEINKLQLKEKFDRIDTLHKSKMISDEEFVNAKYNLKAAIVDWQLAGLELNHAHIKSPIKGIVADRFVSTGDLVQTSSPLFRVFNPDSLLINIYLPEKDTLSLQPGMKADIYSDSIPTKTFFALITRINPSVDPQTGTVKVTLELLNHANELKPGIFVRVVIIVQKKQNAILVPKKAVLHGNGTTSVYVFTEDGHAEKRELEIGLEDNNYFEILDGLEIGERIIIVGQHGIEPDVEVYDIHDQLPTQEIQTATGESIKPE